MIFRGKRFTISIRVTVLTLIIIISSLTAGLALVLHYHFSKDLARTAAERSFRSTATRISERIAALDLQATNIVNTFSGLDQLRWSEDAAARRHALDIMAGAMKQNDNLYAMYVGYANGDFLELVNLESGGNVRAHFVAAPHDRWVTITVTKVQGRRLKILAYLDENLETRVMATESTVYDPRLRPWYLMATQSTGAIRTPPYVFSHLNAPGVTYARLLNSGQGVVSLDISLEGMSAFLARQQLYPGSETFIFDADGDVIAHGREEPPAARDEAAVSLELTPEETEFVRLHHRLRASNEMDWPPFDFALSGKPKGYSIDLLNLLAAKAGFQVEYVNGYTWNELVDLFQRGDLDLLHSLLRTEEREDMGLFTASYLPMPQALAMRADESPAAGLDELRGRVVAIPRGWATGDYLENAHPEIELLWVETPLDALRAVADGRADATLDSRPVLTYLLAAYFFDDLALGPDLSDVPGASQDGLRFLVRNDLAPLQTILDKALLSLTDEERAQLDQAWFGQGSPGNQASEEAEEPGAAVTGTVPRELQNLATRGNPGLQAVHIGGTEYMAYVAAIPDIHGSGEFVGVLAPKLEIIRPYMNKVRLSVLVTMGMLLLLAPLVWFTSLLIIRPINALVQESEKVRARRYDDVVEVPSNITEIIGLSRSMVAMAESIQAHEAAQRALMDSFIKLIAEAIDQKSPYTGGHCSRVPHLAEMLLKAAHEERDGPFAAFRLDTADQWREFHIAAWLHDCGKVTTPEYIVDKGTKLEAIVNRIHEVRMRFEVLLRDAEIAYWKAVAQGGDKDASARDLDRERERITSDFAFVAQCNMGAEFMAPEHKERITAIAQRTWTRHLDNRLGLGHLELARYTDPAPDIPCQEPLLADRPEHIIPRRTITLPETKGAPFNMPAPEHLYNQGEIHNLCIERGTLTPEDRYKINEHIVATIRMLETLPYPDCLAKIPEYAGAHHETLKGTGYPRGLADDKLSTPARVLALADVFEALTASDRPYKKAKKLSEAVRILSHMCADKHIDADLFRLFLAKGVHLEYARNYLAPEQIDDVDVAPYMK